MEYLITFSEGLLSFLSPCLLPLLPVYVSYLAGSIEGGADGDEEAKNDSRAKPSRAKPSRAISSRAITSRAISSPLMRNAIGFVLGFTTVFVLMGAAAGTIGRFAARHTLLLNLVGGGLLILFGLNYLEVIRIPFLSNTRQMQIKDRRLNLLSAALFGAVFALGWTPCVGAFLGSALMMAAQAKTAVHGILLLLAYSLGLGVPFLLSAVLIKQLSGAFSFIKKHYRVINIVSGGLLVVLGILMMLGLFGV